MEQPMEGISMNKRITVFCFVLSLGFSQNILAHNQDQESVQAELAASCLNPEVKSKDDSNIKAVNFAPLSALTSKQNFLLSGFLNHQLLPTGISQLIIEHNDQAATFYSLTFALMQTELYVSDSEKINALDMVEKISEIRGVRFEATLNVQAINAWMKMGGKYIVHHADGSVETGKAGFANHNQKGGGLHCGFDMQGYTHYNQTPYIHWNVKLSDGSADLHLDGIQPWVAGIIPNPSHLDYNNSDVRSWYGNFLKKYGNPGFSIQ
jgi:hypothetical protein